MTILEYLTSVVEHTKRGYYFVLLHNELIDAFHYNPNNRFPIEIVGSNEGYNLEAYSATLDPNVTIVHFTQLKNYL